MYMKCISRAHKKTVYIYILERKWGNWIVYVLMWMYNSEDGYMSICIEDENYICYLLAVLFLVPPAIVFVLIR
jgi:hypothetical protein